MAAAGQAYQSSVSGHPELVEQNLAYYNPAAHSGTGWEDVSINRWMQDNPAASYSQMAEAAKGAGITNEDLYNTAKKQNVALKQGDYVIVRTGMMERCQKAGSWDGYPGGDAPGFAFETLDFVKDTKLAALASDTWGCEVRPNQTEDGINQPWHWITIPIMGMTMGEIFELKALADDCEGDKVYEFLFVAPAIPITGAVGSPVNPLAIK